METEGGNIERRYHCPNCNKAYTMKGNLQRHLNNECNVEPRFRCKFCLKKFTHKFNLQRHIMYKHQARIK